VAFAFYLTIIPVYTLAYTLANILLKRFTQGT